MKARPQGGRRETTGLIDRAQRVLRESRKLLEQREAQLEQLEQLLEENPQIAHGIRVNHHRQFEEIRAAVSAGFQAELQMAKNLDR